MSLDAELEHIRNYMDRFIQQWCPDTESRRINWHLLHDALCSWLLLAMHVARVRFQSASTSELKSQRLQDQIKRSQQDQQQLLVNLSTSMFEEALKVPSSLVITHRASIMPFAASLILRLSKRRDLVLRAALRMAREPGRATVRTFVRDAGRQMLVMLQYFIPTIPRQTSLADKADSTNKSRNTTPPLSQDGVEQPEPTFESDSMPNAGSDQQRLANAHSEQPTAPAGHLQARRIPSPAATQLPQSFEPFMEPIIPIQDQPTFDPTFAFNFTDFPYIPEPPQTQLSPQGSLCPPWTATELDAWVGTAVSQSFPSECQQSVLLHPEGCEPNIGMSLRDSFSPPFNGPCEDQQQPPQATMSSAWGVQNTSPFHTTITASSNRLPSVERSAQREVLLAAVDRLVQLATLMQ